VTRIDPAGILRADEACRACVVAWWRKPGVIIPAAILTTVGVIEVLDDDEPKETSPSRPR